MFGIFKETFTWWHNQTIGTRFFTLFYGWYVGKDSQKNRYYTSRNKKRRWVLYHGLVEASRVPPLWDAWLRYTCDEPPTEEETVNESLDCQRLNLTGTPHAYHPKGSLHAPVPAHHLSYKAWRPSSHE